MQNLELDYEHPDLRRSRKWISILGWFFALLSFSLPAVAGLLIHSAPYYLLHPLTALAALAACIVGGMVTAIGPIFGVRVVPTVIAAIVNIVVLMDVCSIINRPVHI